MGTTNDLLKAVQEKREKACHCDEPQRGDAAISLSSHPENKQGLSPQGAVPSFSTPMSLRALPIIFTFVIILSLITNIALFIIANNNSKKSGNIIAEIEGLNKTMTANNQTIRNNNRILLKKISQFDSKIKALENNQSSQGFAIDNLTKAKNNIFKRVSNLESVKETSPSPEH